MASKIEYKGQTYSVKQIAEMAGISVSSYQTKVYNNGWTIEDLMAGEKINKGTRGDVRARIKGRKLRMFASCAYRCNAK